MFSKSLTIANYTLREFLKSKILYITLVIGLALIVVTFVATEFTYGVPERIALDFGLGMLSLSSLGIALFMGASLLPNELDSRTVYMVISRPVSRNAFITGKILGLVGVLIINVSILSLMTMGSSLLIGGVINQVIIWAIFFNFLESLLLLLLVVFMSLFINTVLSSLFSLIILLLGHAVKETQSISFAANRDIFKIVLEFYHLILPGFYKLNLKDFVLYNQALETSYLLSSFLYGCLYSLALFLLILFFFNKKNLD